LIGEWDYDMSEQLDLTPSPRLLEVLGDIPYQPWQCLAELVDNAFDEFGADPDRNPSEPPLVYVTLPKVTTALADAHVSVSDNGRGMSQATLQNALRAGFSGNSRYGSLGLFGMGFNIATARLGNKTEVKTTQAGDEHWLVTEIDFRELQRRESFHVPLRRAPKEDLNAHGTIITVRELKPNMFESLKRSATISKVRERLGVIYSYLLRSQSPIPEVPDGDTLAGQAIGLLINGRRVQPRIPCVWSATRSVRRHGADVSAVRVIDRKLTDAYACLDCGHWHRDFDVERCVECESENLELRQRRVHGWLGVQRYLDETDYGIDFLRHGRKILCADKSLFTWTNTDDGETLAEYPVDLPHNQGRLIGEIHIDHVPVNYQKTDFDQTSREWRDAVLFLRGEGPMREKKAKDRGFSENDSPLGVLFRAYQENRPGIRCLIPGNGNSATHQLASEWGRKFHEGLPEFQSDDKWYQAVLAHEEAKDRETTRIDRNGDEPAHSPEGNLGLRTGLAPITPDNQRPDPQDPASVFADPPPAVETDDQRYGRYRGSSRRLHDLDGEITAMGLGRRHVSVFETSAPVADASGNLVPVVSRVTSGLNLEVYVHGEHEIFREFGRDPRDYAIMEMAHVLRALARDSDSRLTVIAAEITQQFPDQRTTDSALRERAMACLRRVRELAAPIISANASEMWSSLPNDDKLKAESDAARADSRLDWLAVTKDGRFSAHLGYEAFAALAKIHPKAFVDGAVFAVAWASWSADEARDRQVNEVARLLETVGGFLADSGYKDRQALAMARLAIDKLESIVVRLGE
jgi:hypothetical protein